MKLFQNCAKNLKNAAQTKKNSRLLSFRRTLRKMQSDTSSKNKDKVRQCSVPLCQAYEKPPFFGFPTKDHMREKWLKALQMKECYQGMRICKSLS